MKDERTGSGEGVGRVLGKVLRLRPRERTPEELRRQGAMPCLLGMGAYHDEAAELLPREDGGERNMNGRKRTVRYQRTVHYYRGGRTSATVSRYNVNRLKKLYPKQTFDTALTRMLDGTEVGRKMTEMVGG